MANTHEHLEQAEHAEHAASDPFNQRVAVSMAIVAACLAGISMVGHRTHNLVLQLQGDAGRLRTEAANAEVEKSNLFAWYQAKRQRQAQLEMTAKQTELIPVTNEDARKKAVADWKEKAAGYNTSNAEKDNLPDLKEGGDEAGKRAEDLKSKAATTREEAEHVHHQANRLDIAHLLAELGLVLCSIALLTKKKAFWYSGIVAAALALCLTASAYMIEPEHHEPAASGSAEKH